MASIGSRLRVLADWCDEHPEVRGVIFAKVDDLEIDLGVTNQDRDAKASLLALCVAAKQAAETGVHKLSKEEIGRIEAILND